MNTLIFLLLLLLIHPKLMDFQIHLSEIHGAQVSAPSYFSLIVLLSCLGLMTFSFLSYVLVSSQTRALLRLEFFVYLPSRLYVQ